MKRIFVIFALAATLVGCAKEDIVREAPRQAIGFGELFVDNATRATDGSYSNTNLPASFKVYGTVTGNTTPANTLNIFNGVDVYKTKQADDNIGDTSNNTWWYDKQYAQYWIPGASYNFAAVVGAYVEAGEASYFMPTKLNTVADDDMHFQDMLYDEVGVPNVAKDYNTPVAFTFTHLLSKVKFTVNSTATGSYKHSVTNITVSNYTSGTYDIAAKKWSGTAGDVSFGDIEGVNTEAGNVTCDYEKLLIPISDSFNVSFTVNTYKGTELLTSEDFGTAEAPITITQDLVAGNAYNFEISCKLGLPITFTFSSLGGWDDNPSISIP